MFSFRRFLVTSLVVLLLLSTIFFVCDRDLIDRYREPITQLNNGDALAVERTIRLYNSIYQDFYATGGEPKLLDSFPASKDLRHFTYRDLGYLQDAGLVLVHDLADFELISLSPGRGNCVNAQVREEWNYIYQSASDRSPLGELSGMTYEATYRLEYQSGKWVITGWEPVVQK